MEHFAAKETDISYFLQLTEETKLETKTKINEKEENSGLTLIRWTQATLLAIMLEAEHVW